MDETIQEAVSAHVRRVAEAREQACEAALQSGRCGVLEEHDRTGVTFTVTEAVPYGQIHVRDRLGGSAVT